MAAPKDDASTWAQNKAWVRGLVSQHPAANPGGDGQVPG